MNVCQVLREDPELAEGLLPAVRERASEECVARAVRLARGRWNGVADARPGGIGLLLLDGLLLRRVAIGDRFGAELLGAGDLLRPWEARDEDSVLGPTTGWRVLTPSRLALLDDQFEQRAAAFPPVTGALVGRALNRARNLGVNMAIVHQSRVSVRVHMILWHLADRWGRVGPEGVTLPLSLPHSVLADLVAAQRPTVTTCLSELTRARLVTPLRSGWLLRGDPPSTLVELRRLALPSASAD